MVRLQGRTTNFYSSTFLLPLHKHLGYSHLHTPLGSHFGANPSLFTLRYSHLPRVAARPPFLGRQDWTLIYEGSSPGCEISYLTPGVAYHLRVASVDFDQRQPPPT